MLAFVCKWNAVGASSTGAIRAGVPTRRARPLTCSIAELFKYPVDFVELARGLSQSVPVRQILERPASRLVPSECLSEVRGAKEKSAATHFFSLSIFYEYFPFFRSDRAVFGFLGVRSFPEGGSAFMGEGFEGWKGQG